MTRPARHDAIVRLPFATVGIRIDDDAITRIEFLPPDTAERAPTNPLAQETVAALKRYSIDPHSGFDLPLRLDGTDFQRRVWRALQNLKSGETISYGELAARLGSGARAVGNACRSNPVPLIVPCHRVVAKHGLGGFAGDRDGGWTAIKRMLLEHERMAAPKTCRS